MRPSERLKKALHTKSSRKDLVLTLITACISWSNGTPLNSLLRNYSFNRNVFSSGLLPQQNNEEGGGVKIDGAFTLAVFRSVVSLYWLPLSQNNL